MEDNYAPRSKRIACIMCRKRKLKCNEKRPACGTCSRLGYECAYDEGRKKSGPKGNYRKQLETRLAQVETLLKAQGPLASVTQENNLAATVSNNFTITSEIPSFGDNVDHPLSPPTHISGEVLASQFFEPAVETKGNESTEWQMISLGIEEPLPSQQAVDELNQIYFDKVHPSIPVIHPPRHLATSILAPNISTAICTLFSINELANGPDLEVKQILPGPRDWTEKEERRRVFWMAFCIDRYASAGTGWPVVFDVRDIRTNVPASEEAFLWSIPQRTLPVTDLLEGRGISTLSTFGSMAFIATLFGQILSQTSRPDPNDDVNDLNSGYWQRHKSLDNILLDVALAMPNCLHLPVGLPDPNSVLCNMVLNTSVICLHQAAICRAEKSKILEQVVNKSKMRCTAAADQVLNIMRTISHVDLSTMNPVVSLCIYVASRVLLQHLRTCPDDTAARSSLQFIFSALSALKHKNTLAESLLVQLEVDIDGTPFSGLQRPKQIISPKEKVSYKSKECVLLLPLEKSQPNDKRDDMNTSPACTSFPNPEKTNGPQTINPPHSLNAGGQSSFSSIDLGMQVSPDTVHSGLSTLGSASESLRPDRLSPRRHWPHEAHSNDNWLNGFENNSIMNSQLSAMTISQFGEIPTPDRMLVPDTIPPPESNGSEASTQVPLTWDFTIPFSTNNFDNGDNMEIMFGEMNALEEAQSAGNLSSTG
ncbi:Zn(II)2Cys6 transcription factor [Aspergillus puulaauensis]|uniref:Zn(2)-C6 fungal-type domain-containing protein n=1 Tax=Aspergillus puulaauensis TaxID=1220207 RepID=A0A7R8ASI5_9EURO|nr:uncharacterized protein APUU_61001A [Aspergillus puulaauensis]BCS27953.1 hypothetical protein APUU_61001A [Aspergillus puulaauensis]